MLTLALAGCTGKKTAIFAGEAEPEDFSLSYQVPHEFNFDIAEAGTYDWAVELTYFSEQMQGWDKVPVYFIHTEPDGKETDGKFTIPVKDAKGWIGEVQDNGNDRLTEVNFREAISLSAGKHSVKFYGDNQQQGQPILGIVRFTFKVYK